VSTGELDPSGCISTLARTYCEKQVAGEADEDLHVRIGLRKVESGDVIRLMHFERRRAFRRHGRKGPSKGVANGVIEAREYSFAWFSLPVGFAGNWEGKITHTRNRRDADLTLIRSIITSDVLFRKQLRIRRESSGDFEPAKRRGGCFTGNVKRGCVDVIMLEGQAGIDGG
jgi:hypothetical protein